MDNPASLTKLLADYGPWGMLALTLIALRLMFGKFEALQQARFDDGKLYAGALKDSAKATEKNNETLADLSAEVARMKLMIEHPRGGS
jgi:hypothetical protein